MSDRKSATKRTAEATVPLAAAADEDVTAGVRELRDHLSRYLDLVKRGRTVAVTEHGTVIATIVPMRFSERTMELYRRGRVGLPTRPKTDARDWPKAEIEGGITDILLEMRDE
jgi:antitoxin (DNA-binding transcriptional repressor) of toxin-antitoxin stability system